MQRRRETTDLNMRIVEELAHALEPDGTAANEARHVLTVVLGALREHGLDGLARSVGRGHADAVLGGAGTLVNVIPSPQSSPGKCAPWLLAVAKGSSGARGLASVTRDVTTHLIDCMGITNRVLLVTDCWDVRRFAAGQGPCWEALARRGVRFTGVLSSPDGQVLSVLSLAR